MKALLIAAALLAPLPASAAQWWLYSPVNDTCGPLEQLDSNIHEPADLVAALQREGHDASWKNYYAKDGGVAGVQVNTDVGSGPVALQMFPTYDLCIGFRLFLKAQDAQ